MKCPKKETGAENLEIVSLEAQPIVPCGLPSHSSSLATSRIANLRISCAAPIFCPYWTKVQYTDSPRFANKSKKSIVTSGKAPQTAREAIELNPHR
jgi:hypothetical protein